MREPVSYRCDECGKVSSPSLEWISVISGEKHDNQISPTCYTIQRGCADPGAKHYCGGDCAGVALKWILSEWTKRYTYSARKNG